MTRVSLTVILVIGALILLDGTGMFMYLSYLPVFVLALLGMGATFVSLGRLRPARRKHALWALFQCVVIMAFAAALPSIPTSGRKRFSIAARSVRPGISAAQVRSVMAAHSNREWSSPTSTTFGFQSEPGTIDVLVVNWSSDHSVVSECDYSVD